MRGLPALIVLFLLSGCRSEMYDQAKYEPLEWTDFYDDNRSARHPVEGTVPRGYLRADTLAYQGRDEGGVANVFPWPVDKEVIERGRERYGIHCAVCHGAAGYGDGMIVQRGFPAPPSFHLERLREAPVGHYYDVMTNGFGVMYPYAARVSPEDRWAIIAYIRALQRSQNARLDDVPAETRSRLQGVAE